jgi:hypothetical protein
MKPADTVRRREAAPTRARQSGWATLVPESVTTSSLDNSDDDVLTFVRDVLVNRTEDGSHRHVIHQRLTSDS